VFNAIHFQQYFSYIVVDETGKVSRLEANLFRFLVRFVGVVGIVDRHCLNIVFINLCFNCISQVLFCFVFCIVFPGRLTIIKGRGGSMS
jgi:hypothetical protein